MISTILLPILRRASERGEVILSEGSGIVWDVGRTSLRVRRSVLAEVYDYDHLSVAFLRLYELEDEEGRRWVSLYVDLNPETPWWDERSRA